MLHLPGIPFIVGSKPDATIAYNTLVSDNTSKTTYTFSATSIGTADDTRLVLVAVFDKGGGARTLGVSSVTIGGVSASMVGTAAQASDFMQAEFWVAAVPTGTTADVVVTWNATANVCIVASWSLYDASSTADDTDAQIGGTTSEVCSINIPAGGVGIAASIMRGATGKTLTFTNLTEDADSNVFSDILVGGASDAFATSQTGLAVTVTPSSSVTDTAMIAASFGKA